MLVKCIECNHQVSEYADMCPHCGCPIEKIKEGLHTGTVTVEVVEETVVTTSFDVLKTNCPVCKNKCESGAENCPICGFNELHKEFINKEDGNLWLETVVIPYRTEWENSQIDLSDFEIEGTVLKRYKGNAEKVIIPEGITSITPFVGYFKTFSHYSNIKSVILPNSLISIDEDAFAGCEHLKSITIPDSVISIGKSAFSGCGLETITIPNCVTSIDECAFSFCENLTSITLSNSITSIKSLTFANCKRLEKIIIPHSVISIDGSAFFMCQNLKKVYIPKNLALSTELINDCHPDLEIIRY